MTRHPRESNLQIGQIVIWNVSRMQLSSHPQPAQINRPRGRAGARPGGRPPVVGSVGPPCIHLNSVSPPHAAPHNCCSTDIGPCRAHKHKTSPPRPDTGHTHIGLAAPGVRRRLTCEEQEARALCVTQRCGHQRSTEKSWSTMHTQADSCSHTFRASSTIHICKRVGSRSASRGPSGQHTPRLRQPTRSPSRCHCRLLPTLGSRPTGVGHQLPPIGDC